MKRKFKFKKQCKCGRKSKTPCKNCTVHNPIDKPKDFLGGFFKFSADKNGWEIYANNGVMFGASWTTGHGIEELKQLKTWIEEVIKYVEDNQEDK